MMDRIVWSQVIESLVALVAALLLLYLANL